MQTDKTQPHRKTLIYNQRFKFKNKFLFGKWSNFFTLSTTEEAKIFLFDITSNIFNYMYDIISFDIKNVIL